MEGINMVTAFNTKNAIHSYFPNLAPDIRKAARAYMNELAPTTGTVERDTDTILMMYAAIKSPSVNFKSHRA